MFDAGTPQLRSKQIRYRVDATVMLPLVSIPVASRSDVGWVAASYRDRAADDGAVMRGYELFSASRPERARGLNRLGFFREALRVTPQGVAWTAYFGAMSSSPEKSYREASKAIDGPQQQAYEITDGIASPQQARARVFHVSTPGAAADASQLYALLRPLLVQPRSSPSTDGTAARPLPAVAFLGALETSFQAAVATPGRTDKQKARVPFVHNGTPKVLEITGVSHDAGKGRRLASGGFVRNPNDVYAIAYRIAGTLEGTVGEFRVWVELPTPPREAADVPLAPIAWEFQARSFLRLSGERTQ
ncbi:MAG: hypothetical protein ACM3NQ_15505 [Bacteroidales bacterium]